VFDLLQGAEQHYRKFKHALINRATVLKAISDTYLSLNTQNFPACHNIRSKLVNLYLKSRIYFTLRRLNKKYEQQENEPKYGSKSIGMRLAVKRIY
jgi:hypothetical protein